MNNELSVKSVFDGWNKKIAHKAQDTCGEYCAGGWLGVHSGIWWDSTNPVYRRIGGWIQRNLHPPQEWTHLYGTRMTPTTNTVHAVIWANNECKLDIEGFKQADRCSQLEELRASALVGGGEDEREN